MERNSAGSNTEGSVKRSVLMIRILMPAASPWIPAIGSPMADILQILCQGSLLTFEAGAIIVPISQTRKLLTIKYDHRRLLESLEDYNMRWLAASYFTVISSQILMINLPMVYEVPFYWAGQKVHNILWKNSNDHFGWLNI